MKLSEKDKFIFNSLNHNDIVLDCGANVGEVTELFANSGAVVYAFESNPHAYNILQNKFINISIVICKNEGVGVKNHKVQLYFHGNSDKDPVYWSTGSSLLKTKPNVNSENSVETKVICLSEFIDQLNLRIKILKIDIEGTECQVLDHLIEKEIINKIDIILVETHDHKIPELVNETKALKDKIKRKGITNIYLNWT